jgi:hypothetical protein
MGKTVEKLVWKVLIFALMQTGNKKSQPTKIHLKITWQKWAVKTIPPVVSTQITRSMTQKTQIHYARMIAMHRARILVSIQLRTIFHATQEMRVRTVLDKL